MTRIAPVTLMYSPKTLWFDAGNLEISTGDHVVVTTVRGLEFGQLTEPVFEMTDKEVAGLKNPLKPVIRVATEQDCAQADRMFQQSLEAMPIFKEMAAELGDEMRPVSVQYLLDGDKAIFYFEAEDRVDFRDLVRKMASKFHVRVEMRQIGVRDEARLIGGLGHCGQELCCKRLGGEFNPVSIRMAKEQDLSLNPQKISGICGRLMCCLRYEYDAYKDFKNRAPKVGATVKTPDGDAKVTALNVPREIVTIKTADDKTVKVPLSSMDAPKEGERPKEIGREAWDEVTNAFSVGRAIDGLLINPQFTGKDKLGEARAVRRAEASEEGRAGRGAKAGQGRKKADAAHGAEQPKKRVRRRRGKDQAGEEAPAAPTQVKVERRRQTKRKSVEIKASPSQDATREVVAASAPAPRAEKAAVRPGQRSSGVRRSHPVSQEAEAAAPTPRRKAGADGARAGKTANAAKAPDAAKAVDASKAAESPKPSRRRRSRGSSDAAKQTEQRQPEAKKQESRKSEKKAEAKRSSKQSGEQKAAQPRPDKPRAEAADAPKADQAAASRRPRRRRSRKPQSQAGASVNE